MTEGWYSGILVCRTCGEKHVAVWPADVLDEERMECPECGHMTAGPVDEDDDE